MRMGRRFYKKWKKEEDDGSDGNIPIRIFLMQGFMRQTEKIGCRFFVLAAGRRRCSNRGKNGKKERTAGNRQFPGRRI